MFDKQVILYALPTEGCSFSLIAGERNSHIRSLYFYLILCYLGLSQESKAVRQRKKIFRESSCNVMKCEVHIYKCMLGKETTIVFRMLIDLRVLINMAYGVQNLCFEVGFVKFPVLRSHGQERCFLFSRSSHCCVWCGFEPRTGHM